MKPGVAASQYARFKLLNGFYDYGREQIYIIVYICQRFKRVEKHSRRTTEEVGRFACDYPAVGKFYRRSRSARTFLYRVCGGNGRAVFDFEPEFVHDKGYLARFVAAIHALALCDQCGEIAADDLLFARFATYLVVAYSVSRHIHAHICRRLVGGVTHQLFEKRVEYGEDLYVSVIIYRDFVVLRKMLRIYHVDVVEVCGRRLVSHVDGVVERQVPYRESLVFCVSRLYAALVIVV